jgi:hypothetical protein
MPAKSATVINLNEYRTGEGPGRVRSSNRIEPIVESYEGTTSPLATGIRDLYPDAGDEVFGVFIFDKLRACAARLRAARGEGLIQADDAISQLKADLATIFLRDELPDSVGAVVVSLNYGLSNTRGQPLSEPQYSAVLQVLESLAAAPSLAFGRAIYLVDKLAAVGFVLDPPEALELFEMLDAEGAN